MKNVTIYTDGACSGNPGPGGYAAILIFGDTEKEICGYEENTTNNRMELTAVIEALKCLKEKCEVNIFTDSTYVANAFLNGWIYGWKKKEWKTEKGKRLNYDLWETLLALSYVHSINWNVVKGHSDNEYNNRCDKLAVLQYSQKQKEKEDLISTDKQAFKYEFPDKEGLAEKVLKKETVFSGRVFDMEYLDVELPDGRKSTREIIRHRGGAAVVAVDKEGNLLMVEQYRIAADMVMLEIPAGKIEPGEEPEACAYRELEEETGMKTDSLKLLTSYYSTPGYCSEKIYIYLAGKLRGGKVARDDEEFMNVKKIPLDEAVKMIGEGIISDGKTVAGIMLAKQFL